MKVIIDSKNGMWVNAFLGDENKRYKYVYMRISNNYFLNECWGSNNYLILEYKAL